MVMSQMVTDQQLITATNTDVLAGTQLDQPGVPGVYTVWVASTQADTLVTITLGGRTIVNNAVAVNRANAAIDQEADNFYQMVSLMAGRPVINITEVTAASIQIRTIFLPAVPN